MISLERLTKKEKIGLAVAGMFVLVCLLDRFAITPIAAKIQSLTKEIALSEKQLYNGLRHLSKKDMILKKYETFKKYEEKTGSDEEETAKLLAEIESLARGSSLILIDMKPQASRKAGAYKQYLVDIEAEGDQESVVSFLYRLNNSTMLLRGEKIRLSLKDKTAQVVKAQITISKFDVL